MTRGLTCGEASAFNVSEQQKTWWKTARGSRLEGQFTDGIMRRNDAIWKARAAGVSLRLQFVPWVLWGGTEEQTQMSVSKQEKDSTTQTLETREQRNPCRHRQYTRVCGN